MRHFLFILGLLLRQREHVPGEYDFLGFEAFTRPTETDDSATTPSADDQGFPKAA